MADDQSRNRLGRGLAALIGDMGTEAVAGDGGRTGRRRSTLTPTFEETRRCVS